MEKEIKYYPLTESHKLLISAERLCGKIYNNLCVMINLEEDNIDPSLMEEAVNKSILRFPSTYIRRHDIKEGKTTVAMQYFVDKPDSKCSVVEFKSDKKLYKYIDKFVKKPFPNDYQDCDLYRVNLVKRENGSYSLLICMYHLIADAYGLIKFVEDVLKVYMAIKNNTEMPEEFVPILPCYEKAWEASSSKKRESDIKFWHDFWNSMPLPQYATINGFHDKYSYIPGKKYGNYLNIFNIKAAQVNYKIPKELNERVEQLAQKNKFSAKVIYLLALKTWLSKQTDKTEEFCILDLIANRSKKDTAKTSGSFASNIYLYLDAKNSMSFLEACHHTMTYQYKGLMHNRATQEEIEAELKEAMGLDKIFDKGWVRGTSAFIFTYQPYFVVENCDIKLSIERFSTGKSPMPMYITVMPIDTYSGDINVNYEYMTKVHKEDAIKEFHDYMLRFLDKATANPELTLEELMNV